MATNPKEIIQFFEDAKFHILMWKPVGNGKFPTEKDWNKKPSKTVADWSEGDQVGILLGTEVPGGFVTDIDVDWDPGQPIALRLLPRTGFTFGHKSKPTSHLFYLTPAPVEVNKFEDVDGTTLLEIRGTEKSGQHGLETMVPPSIWTSKDGSIKEPLEFQSVPGFDLGELTQIVSQEELDYFNRRVTWTAIGMILAKHLGINGFGHEPRKAWCGYLLKMGIPQKDLIDMGEAMSIPTNNTDLADIRRVVESTAIRMTNPKQKIPGAPALAKFLGDRGKEVIEKINKWLGRESDFIRSKNGAILANSQENIHRALDTLGVTFRFDCFSLTKWITRDGKSMAVDDATMNALRMEIDREYRFMPPKEFFYDVVDDLVYRTKFHPVRDYLDSLEWDGKPRINNWLQTYAGAENTEFNRTVGATVLVAAVRRVRQPGVKFDEMLVLITGKQGTDKSSALRGLTPDDAWFSDDVPLNVDAKQIIERTGGKWIIEAAELQGLSVREENHLKAMLSRQVDGPVRLAYGRASTEVARQFVFIGTTNTEKFLKDKTGNRRFWPVAIKVFDSAAIRRDRDQLWAEAAHMEARGVSIRLHPDLYSQAEEQQDSRRIDDPWEIIIEGLVTQGAELRDIVPVSEIWEALGTQVSRLDMRDSTRVSGIMQRLGYSTKTKCRPSRGASPVYCWLRQSYQEEFGL